MADIRRQAHPHARQTSHTEDFSTALRAHIPYPNLRDYGFH